MAYRSKLFPQDRKGRQFELYSPRITQGPDERSGETSVRTLLAVHAHSATGRSIREGQHQPRDGRKPAWGHAR